MNEVWKDIPGYESYYQVSNCGRVRSLDRVILTSRDVRNLRGRILSPRRTKYGHLTVALSMYGICKNKSIHRLLMLAFTGLCPPGKEVCHNDGDASNNYLNNLRYDTHLNNQSQMKDHGTNNPGEKRAQSKLTNKQVLQVIERHQAGESQVSISKSLDISDSIISAILTGKKWSEITGIIYDVSKCRPYKILTIMQASNILSRYKQGVKQVDLIKEFGVSQSVVNRLVNGVTWKELHQ